MTRQAREDGIALVIVLLAMLLVGALGSALAVTTAVETAIAGNYLRAEQARTAADAVLERALVDLSAVPALNLVLAGALSSSFADGAPSGVRVLADGSPVDLDASRNLANCGRSTVCSSAQLTAITPARPWGPNNPVWQIFAYGPIASLLPHGVESACYAMAMVGDDPSETDGDPLTDGAGAGSAGAGVVVVRAEAFCPRGAHRVLLATIARDGARMAIVSWRILAGPL
jgi:hypothetical protein